MIKVKKDFDDIPTILKKDNREQAFKNNILSKRYIDKKNLYRTKSILDKLNEIYHKKCAYCEQSLLDSQKHIEHYRPKKRYFWLTYSWDNLLLSCERCNKSKGIKFKTKNRQVDYNNESFEDIDGLCTKYDRLEEPLIVNPERDNILDEILYYANAEIYSTNEKVTYTIEKACKLNREELVQKRIMLFNNFRQNIESHYVIFKIKKDTTRFVPDIENFIKNCNKINEFYSFRYFIIRNIDIFFDGELGIIIKVIIKKLSNNKLWLKKMNSLSLKLNPEKIIWQ